METIELLKKSHNGDKVARDTLVSENVGLIWSVVKRFSGRGYDMEDLFQIGCIGMLKAIDKFDFNFDVKFSTYAVPMISGEVKRFLRDDGMIKISRSIKENNWKILKAKENYINKNGKEPTIEEISIDTGIEPEDIVIAMEAGVEVGSIYKSVYQDDGSEVLLLDKLQQEGDESEKLLDHMLLAKLVKELPQKEQNIIRLRYFQNKTQTEVAKIIGISQVQVSRLEKKILLKLREEYK